ncbi:MAG: cation-transporting P-type ATPase [Gammaproteobacteria bacterium]|nr:cation-transporting P-type ATPase [Gammaproteobacteria bacterium]MBU1415611.1 cation-transporting P-type ATPase [Gammaproteobacteria bacterium]
MTHAWHALGHDEVTAHHAVDATIGLTDDEAAARLARHGPNRPKSQPPRHAARRLLDQLIQPLVLVLIASGTVTALLGEWVDTGVILGVVVINAIVGFIQEGRAESALAALARALSTEATVLRGGQTRRIDAEHVVPGDIIHLAAGDKVPADLRLMHGRELRTAEAALTGESLPVAKHPATLDADTRLADRRNMAYAGTHIVTGHGRGIVVATGEATETGRIARLIAEAPQLETPLTRKMAAFSRQLLVAILVLAALTFVVGLWRGKAAFDMFMAAVALAVAAIPEGLPAALTITLAIGVGRMAKRRAIIRRLPAVEALGSTTVICSDKTGTLTKNQMTVREIWAGNAHYNVSGDDHGGVELAGQPATIGWSLKEVLVAGVLCNDAALRREEGHWQMAGDPTEGALLVAARKGKLDETTLRELFPRLDELPFDSSRQAMATLHDAGGEQNVIYVKGAVERILPACADMLDTHGRHWPLDAESIAERAAAMAAGGLRVLALARKAHMGESLGEADIGTGLTFVGMVGMVDPPRSRAIGAVRACHTAGIRVKMITGDHGRTALAIARQIGICAADARALTGRELAELDEAGLREAVRAVDVFARVEPEQKLRLVGALQANGEVVAMTGDGVNDAPALKQADIGIAMGLGGTEVAKEAADMVLTDDNFATIEAAVEEGRGIYDNLVKFITWTLPTNFGEGLVILAAILLGVTLPITPLQILWINMTTAVLLGLPLAFEPREAGIMHRPPRPPATPVLDRALVSRIVLVGILMLAGSFGLYEVAVRQGRDLAEARTIAVNVFVMMEIFYLFNCRSLTQPFWRLGWFSNPWVWVGAGSMLLLQLMFTYLPPFHLLFGTAAISLYDWLPIVLCGFAAMATVGIEKWLRRR